MAEQALERSERMAIANRYAGAIIHEVNNPLEAIANLAYLTKLEVNNPAQVIENMETIELQIETVGKLTRRALTFHRDQDSPSESDLVEITKSALKLYAEKIARHGVAVELNSSDPVIVWVFESEILQVISNLVLNALEAVPSGDGRLSLHVSKTDKGASITVSDNGKGVPENMRERLFEPYVTSKRSGTGLGLWLSGRIIKRHGGTIQVHTSDTEPNRGSSFCVTLPISQTA